MHFTKRGENGMQKKSRKKINEQRHYYRLIKVAIYSAKEDIWWDLRKEKRHIIKCYTEEEISKFYPGGGEIWERM